MNYFKKKIPHEIFKLYFCHSINIYTSKTSFSIKNLYKGTFNLVKTLQNSIKL